MSLGMLARDSMLDLASLASSNDNNSNGDSPEETDLLKNKDSNSNNKSSSNSSRPAPEVGTSTMEHVVHDDPDHHDDKNKNDYDAVSTNKNKNAGTAGTGAAGGAVTANSKRGGDAKVAANPQQAQEEDTDTRQQQLRQQQQQQQQKMMYAGFSHDYPAYKDMEVYDYNNYFTHDTYAPVIGEKQSAPTCWACLFPWMRSSMQEEDAPSPFETGGHLTAQEKAKAALQDKQMSTSDDDAEETNSINSDLLGERLSTRERQAVLARLRLADPNQGDSSASSTGSAITSENAKGLLNGINHYDGKGDAPTDPLASNQNGKRRPRKSILKRIKTEQNDETSNNAKDKRRRSLFPQYENKPKNQNHIKFAPMARVVTVKSKNDMTPEEKSDIWWQKYNYEDFRKTGRIITRAMLEGGSEIWLSKASNEEQCNKTADTISTARDKWWHQFGHSRRGLEHVVSVDEGRQRQLNVRTAIHSVLEEQSRQKRYKREDPDKLRIVSLNHTSWARDLALASGASDADAVTSAFAEGRKSREFYLLKIARNSPVTTRRIPEFMQPAIRAGRDMKSPQLTSANRLDTHTAAQINYRRETSTASSEKAPTKSKDTEQPTEELTEPIKDPAEQPQNDGEQTMAQLAMGFSSVDDEKMDMAAVLSGMGAVPHHHTQGATTVSS